MKSCTHPEHDNVGVRRRTCAGLYVASCRNNKSNVDKDKRCPRSHEHGAAAKSVDEGGSDDGRHAGEGGKSSVDTSLLLSSSNSDKGQNLRVIDRDDAARAEEKELAKAAKAPRKHGEVEEEGEQHSRSTRKVLAGDNEEHDGETVTVSLRSKELTPSILMALFLLANGLLHLLEFKEDELILGVAVSVVLDKEGPNNG